MNFLQRLILGKKLVGELQQKAVQTGVRYIIQNGRLVTPVDNKDTYIKDGFSINDIIYSVCAIQMDKIRLPDWKLFKVVKESSLKEAESMLNRKYLNPIQRNKALKLKSQSLEEISSFNLQQGKLKDLLQYPNECHTFQEFIAYGCLFKLLTGDTFIWGDLLSAGANQGIPQSLWVLPSQYVNIKASDRFPPVASGYELTIWNQKFAKETILHEKYPNPNWDFNGEQLYGFSPLRPLQKNTLRNNAAKDASYSKLHNGGLETIIYMDDPRYDAAQGLEAANSLKMRLAEEYSGPSNQGKYAISGVKAGAVPLGMSPVELAIIDSEKFDLLMFCNAMGVPPALLNPEHSTFNNLKEAEKALTTRSILPLLVAIRNAINRKLQNDWGFKGQNIYVDFNTECFPELDADLVEVSQWMDKLIMMKPDEQRENFGMDALNIPESQEIWVRDGTTWRPLSDYQANQVDEALMREQMISNAGNEDKPGKAGSNGQANGKTGKERVSYS